MAPTTALEQLQPVLQTAKTLTTGALTTAGIPTSYAPLALMLGGLAGIVMLLSMAGSGSREGVLRRTAETDRRALGTGTGTPRHGSPTGKPDAWARTAAMPGHIGEGGHGRKDEDDGADWAADEVAILEHSGGKEPPPRGWLVPDLVPHGPVPVWRWYWRRPTRARPLIDREVKGYTTVVLGSGGTGKSYCEVDLGVAALTGGTWLGKPVQRVKRVLYVDCELDAQTFWTRAYAVARGRGLKAPPKGLTYLRLYASLASWDGQQQVRDAVRKSKADLILVDSLTIGAHGLALADSNGWRRVYAGFERWGKPVVAIDHLGKEAGRGAVGSFMKQAMVRSALTMERERGVNIKVEHSKTNFGPQVETFRVSSSFKGGKDGVPLTVSFTAALPADVVPAPTPTAQPVRQVGERVVTEGPRLAVEQPTPQVTHHSPIIAWLKGHTVPVPASVIRTAAPGGMAPRTINKELLALTTAGQLERSGEGGLKGYAYRLPGYTAITPSVIAPKKRSKFNACKTEYPIGSGVIYDSAGEARYAAHLDTLKAAGTIVDWRRGRPWVLQDADPANDVPEITYRPDYEILDAAGVVIEARDFKGMLTPIFKMKSKMFKARYPDVPLVVVTKADLPV